ncbi:MAG: SCE4755 family polysaccharide monooxygenase-like protein [Kofleriaceae bacterium]
MRAFAAVAFLVPGIASAHIHLTFPLSRTDSLTGAQKEEHCGVAAYDRALNPGRTSVFAPGATITVTWLETVQHPGHFRIAFQPEGAVFGIPPAGPGKCHRTPTLLVDCPIGVTDCDFPPTGQEGLDPVNGSIVLADFITDGTLAKDITLPNIECTNCTLQLFQLMTDKCPYTTDLASNDLYFNCADLTLSATAPDAGAPPADADPPGDDAGANPATGDGGGGCCSTTGNTANVGLAWIAWIVLRRRARRSVPGF